MSVPGAFEPIQVEEPIGSRIPNRPGLLDVGPAQPTSGVSRRPQTLNAFIESQVHEEELATPSVASISSKDEVASVKILTPPSTSRNRLTKGKNKSPEPQRTSRSTRIHGTGNEKPKPTRKRRHDDDSEEDYGVEPSSEASEAERMDGVDLRSKRKPKDRAKRRSIKSEDLNAVPKTDRVLRSRGVKPSYSGF